MFQLRSSVHSEQTFSIVNHTSISLEHVSVQADVSIDHTFHELIRRSLKKSLPSQVSIQLLFASPEVSTAQLPLFFLLIKSDRIFLWFQLSRTNSSILNSLIPLKPDHDQFVPTGLIFIGFATHQTTGIGFHIHSHLIPTIERESLDMQDPYIAVWNRELLTFGGQIVRSIYDRMILQHVSAVSNTRSAALLLAPFAFQKTTPDRQIGEALFNGFFSDNVDVQVPVRSSSNGTSFTLFSSSSAFLSTSPDLEAFLSLPLVPFELIQCGLFSQLKKTAKIREITNEEIISALSKQVIDSEGLIHLMRWLRKEHNNDKTFLYHVRDVTRFQESHNSSVVLMKQIQYYDGYQVSKHLPLPTFCLPASIACQFSADDLRLYFSLNTFPLQSYLQFYLSPEQLYLFCNARTSEDLLRFFCKYSSQLTESDWKILKDKLGQIKCILTSQGMKFPNESYIPSSFSNDDVPLITFQFSTSAKDKEHDPSIFTTFLKRIGCRMCDVRLMLNARNHRQAGQSEAPSTANMKEMIRSLLAERSELSENDLKALREEKFLTG